MLTHHIESRWIDLHFSRHLKPYPKFIIIELSITNAMRAPPSYHKTNKERMLKLVTRKKNRYLFQSRSAPLRARFGCDDLKVTVLNTRETFLRLSHGLNSAGNSS